jgi:hypothetical protein
MLPFECGRAKAWPRAGRNRLVYLNNRFDGIVAQIAAA